MKPWRNCPAAGRNGRTVPAAEALENAAVNRYSHPIVTKNHSNHTGSVEELLSYILETLSHHSDLLEELLRRTEKPDTPDTM